jgi:DNA-binding CsgD family transcriptional regulator
MVEVPLSSPLLLPSRKSPLKMQDLLKAVRAAIDQDQEELTELQQRFSRLAPRERQVLQLVVSGLLNKQAALELGMSETTLQIHRGSIMQKMAAGSFADLVRMAATLRVPLARYGNARFDSCAAPSGCPGCLRAFEVEPHKRNT